MNNNKEEIH